VRPAASAAGLDETEGLVQTDCYRSKAASVPSRFCPVTLSRLNAVLLGRVRAEPNRNSSGIVIRSVGASPYRSAGALPYHCWPLLRQHGQLPSLPISRLYLGRVKSYAESLRLGLAVRYAYSVEPK